MKKQTAKVSAETVTNRILIAFTLTFIGLLAAVYVNNNLLVPTKMEHIVVALRVIAIAAAAVCLFAVGYRIFLAVRKIEAPVRVITPMGVAFVAFQTALYAFLIPLSPLEMPKRLFIAIPAVAVLYIVYYIYNLEFFLSAVALSGSALLFSLVYMLQNGSLLVQNPDYSVAVLLALVFIFMLIFDFLLRRGDGKIVLGKLKIRLLPKGFSYRYLYLVFVFILLGFAVCFLFSYTGAYYMVIASLVFAFVYAVYFTIRLI